MLSSNPASNTRARDTETPRSSSGRRTLFVSRGVAAVRDRLADTPRLVTVLAATAVVLLAAALGIPAYGQSLSLDDESAASAHSEASASPSQIFTVPSDVLTATIVRDSYAAKAPPSVVWPIPASSPITSGIGPRASCAAGCSTWHQGADFTPGNGTQIVAATGGTVTAVNRGNYWSLGQHVVIETVLNGQRIETVYAHMQHGSIAVAAGQTVRAGSAIGRVGSTGVSTGPHLHFEVRVNGAVVDPVAWLRSHA